MKKGHYVVASIGGGKTQLLKVDMVEGSYFLGTIAKNSHIPELKKSVEHPIKSVVVDLGKDPIPGKVYNQDLNKLFKGKKEVKHFGEFYFFYKPSKETFKNLSKASRIVAKRLKKLGIYDVLSNNIYWEVEPATGQKYAGMYKRTANKDFVLHQISIRPETMAPTDYPYVLCHELGHLLHFNYLERNTELEAKWIDAYNKSVKRLTVSKEDLQDILSILMEGEVKPSRLRAELDEEQRQKYQLILKQIRSSHKLGPRDLDVLFTSGLRETLKDIWPKTIPNYEPQPILTDYAMVNFKELIAESFAFYLTGKEIPKALKQLVERSISYIKTQL